MLHKIKHAASYFTSRGPLTFAREIRHRAYAWHYERQFGIDTRGWIQPKELGHTSPDAKPYGPIGYEHIFWALDRIPFPASEVEFVDYGCGRGRVIVSAGARPYRKVTGVELAPRMATDARRNIERLGAQRKAPIEVWEGDAAAFPISPTANVFYFFNPFGGATLEKVTANIRESVARHPRPAFVIFFNVEFFAPLVDGASWIRPVASGDFYPNYSCTLYQIDGKNISK